MSFLNLLEKHISYTSAGEVREICHPLFEQFNLNYFDYVRVYPDGSTIILISNRDWYYHFCKSNYPVSSTIVNSGIHLWSHYITKQAVKDPAQYFNHHNGITIFVPNKNYIEFFDIAAPSSNRGALDFYFNRMDILNQFLFYFKDKASNLIDKSYKNRFMIPDTMKGSKIEIPTYDDFLKAIAVKKFHMNFQSKEVILTKREYECLMHLSRGKTMKETAKKLKLSPRTIEDHLVSAREKTDFISRAKMIDAFLENLIFW